MYKSKLQELCQQRKWDLPQYSTSKDGKKHPISYTSTVTVNGRFFATPKHRKSTKESQNDVAMMAFQHLSATPQLPTKLPITTTPEPPTEPPINTTTTPEPPTEPAITTTPEPPTEHPITTTPETPTETPITTTAEPPIETPITTTPEPPITTMPEPPTETTTTSTPEPPTEHPITITIETPITIMTEPPTETPICSTPEPPEMKMEEGDPITLGTPQEENLSPEVNMAEADPVPLATQPENDHAAMANRSSPNVNEVAPIRDVPHLCKHQLQMYAQKRSLPLPRYSCENRGPPHNIRYKCKVTIDGQTFQGPKFCKTVKEAEHTAARVALMAMLSTADYAAAPMAKPSTAHQERDSGPRDANLFKNHLQELAQKGGYALPVYETVKTGGYNPGFTSTVEIAGERFTGRPQSNKKKAEMSAAKVAYITLIERKGNHRASTSHGPVKPASSVLPLPSTKFQRRAKRANEHECPSPIPSPSPSFSHQQNARRVNDRPGFTHQRTARRVNERPRFTHHQNGTSAYERPRFPHQRTARRAYECPNCLHCKNATSANESTCTDFTHQQNTTRVNEVPLFSHHQNAKRVNESPSFTHLAKRARLGTGNAPF
ncbi:hypothetical protein SAY86_018544 [Trapa natans]|uniref:DRBM domain-containing protein n=1 Tax=Trapa natans TaxID=22666 RepID=A0AAN7LNG9_TRANT|nr:hypothetical protein SAY86_018544 [Trapa natans]